MARSRRYCVFRIVNEARKEIFLVATSQPIFRAIARIREHRPLDLQGWDLEDISRFESLEFNLSREAALDFVKARVERGTSRGYRYILDLDTDEPPR